MDLKLNRQFYLKRKSSLEGIVINGRFRVIKKIGQGAYGKVFKGLDAQNKKLVAMKLIDVKKLEYGCSEQQKQYMKRRIKSEGDLLRKFNHPNILECFEVLENEDFKLIITKYCENGTLLEQIQKKKAFYVDEAIQVIHQIILGLSEMHSKNIIHRDLKPDNIIIHCGTYKIGDFGFSKEIPEKLDNHTYCGTPYYRAPEINQGKKYNIKADIYSLGVIFYQMICSSEKDIHERIKRTNRQGWENFKVRGNQKPSELIMNFLSRCLCDQEDRMGWKQLKEHKIFLKNRRQLSNSYEIPVMSLSQLEIDHLVEAEKNSFENKVFNSNIKSEQITQDLSIKIEQIVFGSDYEKKIEKQIEDPNSEEQIYKQLVECNLSCLKANYIFLNYIMPIENQKFLNLDDISNIQLMFFLSSRCFFYVSRVKNYSYKHKNIDRTEELKQFEDRIDQIYKVIKKNYENYSKKLFEKEKSFKEMSKNKFKQIFRRSIHEEEEKMFGGIENVDYSFQEHLQYTQDYLNKKVNQIKCNSAELNDRLVSLFLKYTKINLIPQDEVQLEKFEKICNKILDKK